MPTSTVFITIRSSIPASTATTPPTRSTATRAVRVSSPVRTNASGAATVGAVDATPAVLADRDRRPVDLGRRREVPRQHEPEPLDRPVRCSCANA